MRDILILFLATQNFHMVPSHSTLIGRTWKISQPFFVSAGYPSPLTPFLTILLAKGNKMIKKGVGGDGFPALTM